MMSTPTPTEQRKMIGVIASCIWHKEFRQLKPMDVDSLRSIDPEMVPAVTANLLERGIRDKNIMSSDALMSFDWKMQTVPVGVHEVSDCDDKSLDRDLTPIQQMALMIKLVGDGMALLAYMNMQEMIGKFDVDTELACLPTANVELEFPSAADMQMPHDDHEQLMRWTFLVFVRIGIRDHWREMTGGLPDISIPPVTDDSTSAEGIEGVIDRIIGKPSAGTPYMDGASIRIDFPGSNVEFIR